MGRHRFNTYSQHSHIVDTLIAERAQNLYHSPAWPLLRLCLNKFLGYRNAVHMTDSVATYSAREVFDYMSALLQIRLDVVGLNHIPKSGPCILAFNHPTGIADGIAVFDAVKKIRPDMVFYANRDTVRIVPSLAEMIIPVEWRDRFKSRAKSRETLLMTNKVFHQEHAVILFPSGRLAYMDENKTLTEQEWLPSITMLARKFDCPIVPARILSRNSWLYYLLSHWNTELRDMTLFRELLNKKKQHFSIQFTPPIAPAHLPKDTALATQMLRGFVVDGIKAGTSWPQFKTTYAPSPTAVTRTI